MKAAKSSFATEAAAEEERCREEEERCMDASGTRAAGAPRDMSSSMAEDPVSAIRSAVTLDGV
jgi:hypothetical protein